MLRDIKCNKIVDEQYEPNFRAIDKVIRKFCSLHNKKKTPQLWLRSKIRNGNKPKVR